MGRGSGGGGRGGGRGGGGGGSAVASPPRLGDGSHNDGRETPEQYAQALGISGQEARERYDAVDWFTQSGYGMIRESQRLGNPSREAQLVEAYVRSITPFKGEIYRGMNWDSPEAMAGFTGQLQRGRTFSLNAMSSFSSNPQVASDFAGLGSGYSAVIRVTRNRSGASIMNRSHIPAEREVLVPSGARYRVVNRRVQRIGLNVRVLVDVEEI